LLELEEYDDRLVNEVMGFVNRCACQAGAHLTDYVVSRGTAIAVAGPTRVDAMLAACLAVGLMTETDNGDGRRAYKLADDDHEFLHLRLRAEVEFEQQRKRDNNNQSLIVPVRIRDGDACRWCGVVVDWVARRSARAATYDHLIPGEPGTYDTYVVACNHCNSSRKNGDKPRGAGDLLAPPEQPYYSNHTIRWLTDNKWRQREGIPVPAPSSARVQPGQWPTGTTPPTTDSGAALLRGAERATKAQPHSRTRRSTEPATSADDPALLRGAEHATEAQFPSRTGRDDRALLQGHERATQAQFPSRTGSTETPSEDTTADVSGRNQQKLAEGQGTALDESGRVGNGTGRVGSAAAADGGAQPRPRRRSRRGGRKRKPTEDDHPTTE
jgi:hypothetical protein